MHFDNDVKKDMENVINHLKDELKALRTGRANPGLVEGIRVEVYGTSMNLKSLANVTVPESRQLLVSPFDPQNTGMIAKAIEASCGFSARVEGNVIRIEIPPMDATIRQEIVKDCKRKAEEAKVRIREVRRKYNEEVKKQKSAGTLAEDDVKREEKAIQDFTDRYCKETDLLSTAKEKEILEI
ncbi:MAG: ribosome recycling factor [Parachlamydiales bacterium]|nr:ribosome recycling factor [Parachlamydiales bacterium]